VLIQTAAKSTDHLTHNGGCRGMPEDADISILYVNIMTFKELSLEL